MMDVVIRGGELIDGSGSGRRRADLGIKDGVISAIGEINEKADRVIDADGRVVCPGFIDVHTHYDAQAFWDGTLSPSPLHGVTSVFGGNCGFSIAPLSPSAGDYLAPMLARVEGMPLESLEQGVPWDWTSFGEYLDRLEGQLSVNAGFLVGHCAIRRVVMGERAVGEEASSEELAAMKTLLADSIAEGGMGFSSTVSPTHNDASGDPVPSRHASHDELVELAAVLRDHPGTSLELIPGVGEFSDEQVQLMVDMSLAGERTLNWNVLAPNSLSPDFSDTQMGYSSIAAEQGAGVVALTVPQPMLLRLNLYSGFVLDALPGWDELFRLPLEERKRALSDPAYRATLDQRANSDEAGMLKALADWGAMTVDQVVEPANEKFKGRCIGDIAREQGKTSFDALVDLSLADGLLTSFMPPAFGGDEASWRERGRVWLDERTVIGGSDAGAHLDMIDTFAFSTQVLGNGVREYGLLDLEQAVHQLTQVPAELYGLRDRGLVKQGWAADLVVFDPDEIAPGETYTRTDLPCGGGRLYAEALGIGHVLVNGSEIVRDGEFTSERPGRVFRSGRDTS
ncbi:MAG: amidohydrolase family protein [Proteobacteria bacterium]|nr:amidohydrolase family protein [Pseudomonadota bacterium]